MTTTANALPVHASAIARFNTLASARSFCRRATKPQEILLGDDGELWCVCWRDADRLLRAGYERAF